MPLYTVAIHLTNLDIDGLLLDIIVLFFCFYYKNNQILIFSLDAGNLASKNGFVEPIVQKTATGTKIGLSSFTGKIVLLILNTLNCFVPSLSTSFLLAKLFFNSLRLYVRQSISQSVHNSMVES